MKKGTKYDGDEEFLLDWVKVGVWVRWFSAFRAPSGMNTDGHWIGEIKKIIPKNHKYGYDKVSILVPGETEYESIIYANDIEQIKKPPEKELENITKEYLKWLNR